jgi:hypothetical protein
VEELEVEIDEHRRTISLCDQYLELCAKQQTLEQVISLQEEILDLLREYNDAFERLRQAERWIADFSERDKHVLSTAPAAAHYRFYVDALHEPTQRLKQELLARCHLIDNLSQELFGERWTGNLSEAVRAFDPESWRLARKEHDNMVSALQRARPGLYLAAWLGGLMVASGLVTAAAIGAKWAVGVLGLAGTALSAGAIRSLKGRVRGVEEAERRLRDLFAGLPRSEELHRRGEEAVAALERLQSILREVDLDYQTLTEIADQVRRLEAGAGIQTPDGRDRSVVLPPGMVFPDDRAGQPTNPAEAVHAIAQKLERLRQRVDQWEDAIREAEHRSSNSRPGKRNLNPCGRRLPTRGAASLVWKPR